MAATQIDMATFISGLDRLNDALLEAVENALEWANGNCRLTSRQINHLAHVYNMNRFPYHALEQFVDCGVGSSPLYGGARVKRGTSKRQIESVFNAVDKLAEKIREDDLKGEAL